MKKKEKTPPVKQEESEAPVVPRGERVRELIEYSRTIVGQKKVAKPPPK